MNSEDGRSDPLLAAVAALKTHDVSRRRAERLRDRCHIRLRAEPPRTRQVRLTSGTLFRRVIGPALGGAWCLAYLVEIIRRAAAVYGF